MTELKLKQKQGQLKHIAAERYIIVMFGKPCSACNETGICDNPMGMLVGVTSTTRLGAGNCFVCGKYSSDLHQLCSVTCRSCGRKFFYQVSNSTFGSCNNGSHSKTGSRYDSSHQCDHNPNRVTRTKCAHNKYNKHYYCDHYMGGVKHVP